MDFSEFTAGVERLVGSGCPNGSGKESLQQQDAAQPAVYLGDFHDDKRHGFGLYKVANGWGYLGGWSLGVPGLGSFGWFDDDADVVVSAEIESEDTLITLLASMRACSWAVKVLLLSSFVFIRVFMVCFCASDFTFTS